MKNIYFTSNASRSSVPTNDGWTCSAYGNGSKGICINNSTSLGFSYVCSGSSTSQSKIWDQCKMDTPYFGSEKILGTTISYTDLSIPKPSFLTQGQASFGFKPLGFTSSGSVVNESSRPEFNVPYFSTPTVELPILGRGLVFSNQGGKSEPESTTDFVGRFLETSKSRAQRLKDNAITKSDHLIADIFTEQAWADDAEWHREIAVKNNDHGEYGIEFRGKQLQACYRNIARLLKELETEAQRIKDNAVTTSDHIKADIIMNEFLITMHEEMRVIAIKKNDHGEQGIEFRSKKITECYQEMHRLVESLIEESQRIKDNATTPSDHLRADILIQETWKTDAELQRKIAIKNNDHGERGIEFRNKQLAEYDKIIVSKLEALKQAEEQNLKKELLEILPQAYPGSGYNKSVEGWHPSWWGKKVIDAGNFEEIKRYLPELRKKAEENNLKKELLEILPQAYPGSGYNKSVEGWHPSWWGKKVIDAGNFEEIKSNLPWLRKKADFEKAIEYSDNILRIKPSYQMNNFDYFLKLPYLSTLSTINLSNNQIGDDGAKLLADSLSKGEMPNLKKLHLEGNNITDTGTGYLSKALDTVEQGLVIVLKTVQNASKAVAQFAIKEMLHIAKSNGISTKEVLTTQETIEFCKKGGVNVGKNIGYGMLKCFTNADKPIAVYEMDFQYLATALTVNIMHPLKKPFQWYCMTESTVFSVVDEDFANCLTGLDSGLNDD